MSYRLMELWGPDAAQRIDPEQMDGWIAWHSIEPVGMEKVCEVLAKGFMHLLAAHGTELDLDYFMPWRAADRPEQTPEEQIARCRLIAAAYGANG